MPLTFYYRWDTLLIFANIGLILAGFVILELLFGSWVGKGAPDVLLTIPRAIRVTVDAGGLYDDPSGTVVVYSRDEYGLRGPYQDISEIDVLTIGGSTTDQRYITDGRTWQAALSQAGVEAGHAFQVANAGVDEQTTYGHIKSFESWFSAIPNLRPRFVLIYTGINDFWVEEGAYNSFDDLHRKNISLADRALERSAFVHVYRLLQGAHTARYEARIFHRGCPTGSRKSAATVNSSYPTFCISATLSSSRSRCAFSIQRCS